MTVVWSDHIFKDAKINEWANMKSNVTYYSFEEIWLHEIVGGILLMCQNTTIRVYEAWDEIDYILSSKICSASRNVL